MHSVTHPSRHCIISESSNTAYCQPNTKHIMQAQFGIMCEFHVYVWVFYHGLLDPFSELISELERTVSSPCLCSPPFSDSSSQLKHRALVLSVLSCGQEELLSATETELGLEHSATHGLDPFCASPYYQTCTKIVCTWPQFFF